jgi:tetratricopeptide (TPR) repeat protein
MPKAASNNVFISYRRDVGGILAMALYQHLAEHGIDAFYDIESIRAGQFDSIILGQIAARPYFLLVLTPGTLDRCVETDDWVRREIDHALAKERVIIPAYTPNFDFGDFDRCLPKEVGRSVRRFNGQELSQKWFEYAVKQLVEEFLVPIYLDTAEVLPEQQTALDRIREKIQEAPTVSSVQLNAHELFERAYAQDDLDGRIEGYSEAISLDPQLTEAFYNRGLARAGKRDWDGAIADYSEAIRLRPELAEGFYSRGLARAGKKDWDGAIADYSEAIRLRPELADAFYSRGLARAGKKDWDGAIADYSTAIRLKPELAEAFYSRGLARAGKKDWDGAIADYSTAIRLKPALTKAFYSRGVARARKKDWDEAIADYTEAIQLNPQLTEAFYSRGLAREGRRQARSASGRDQRGMPVLQRDPSAYVDNQKDLDGAIADYGEAIRLNPQYTAPFEMRGFARLNRGDRDGAIADFSDAIRINPQYAEAFWGRASAREALGDLDGAVSDLQEAIRYASHDWLYRKQLEQVLEKSRQQGKSRFWRRK